MAVHPARAPSSRHRRPLIGVRRTPGRAALALFRQPLHLYQRGWGWMLGRTFVLLVHIGRTTGRPHETVAMVVGDNAETGEVLICSAWGKNADWIRNLHAGPAREVCIGRGRFVPDHRFLSNDEGVAVVIAFRQRHPYRMRLMGTILGWGDLSSGDAVRDFVTTHPFVALRPTT
jgi:deazaflavin-dependent oxidoreductase (nitroreductase family)